MKPRLVWEREHRRTWPPLDDCQNGHPAHPVKVERLVQSGTLELPPRAARFDRRHWINRCDRLAEALAGIGLGMILVLYLIWAFVLGAP